MKRFSVISFQTVIALWSGRVEEKGSGILFVPVDERSDWPTFLNEIIEHHFRHPLGRTIELGIALLDEDLLDRHCHRHRNTYWQGGDHD